ncbi:MAG: hypothetical protein NT098_04545 [Candidatus Parcubacteria bacterium]|nr:hypothetical protein [Candidatus Parcubacteria bacterium]
MTQEKLTCLECGNPAEWVRYTQFSGDFPYCEACAKKEEDFPEGDGSYSDWDKWPPEESAEQENAKIVHSPEDRKKIIEKIFPDLKKETPSRLHQIRKEICEIREEADARISLLNKEAKHLFEESPTIEQIDVGQKFLYDLYSPVCVKTEGSWDVVIDSEREKGKFFRLKKSTKVFLIE